MTFSSSFFNNTSSFSTLTLADVTSVALASIPAWLDALPVWDGVSALPVESGQWFMNNGKPEQAT